MKLSVIKGAAVVLSFILSYVIYVFFVEDNVHGEVSRYIELLIVFSVVSIITIILSYVFYRIMLRLFLPNLDKEMILSDMRSTFSLPNMVAFVVAITFNVNLVMIIVYLAQNRLYFVVAIPGLFIGTFIFGKLIGFCYSLIKV